MTNQTKREPKMEETAQAEEDFEGIGGINITPLVDVALTLVLIFMVVLPASVIHAINVRSQILRRYGLSSPQENVRVHLTARGIFVQDERSRDRLVGYDHFGIVLSQMVQISSTKRLLLRCDRDVPHGQAVWALDIAKQNGAQDLSLVEGE